MSSLDRGIACPNGPATLEVSELSGTAVIRLRGSLDVETAGTVRRFVISLAERTEIAAFEVDLRDMEGWTLGGLRELGICAAGCVSFRIGPHAPTVA